MASGLAARAFDSSAAKSSWFNPDTRLDAIDARRPTHSHKSERNANNDPLELLAFGACGGEPSSVIHANLQETRKHLVKNTLTLEDVVGCVPVIRYYW
jgi:hypothetical protein